MPRRLVIYPRMLTHLTVRNFALARHIELDFNRGMTVITGETGAGKSILLDALGLALGDRADTGAIAAGADRAEVCATFDLARIEDARAWLAQRELDTDGECILRRTVSADGRSKGYINGTQVTVREMKALGDMLIDIHSQHEHQSLLKRDTHRRLLDAFADATSLAAEVSELAGRHAALSDELSGFRADSEEQQARFQLLTYQVEELATLALGEDETTRLEEEQRRLAGAESILTACRNALDACTEAESGNASDLIGAAIAQLKQVDIAETRAIVDMLESSRIQLQEASSDLSRFESTVELDPARLSTVESRLDDIYTAARKHRVEPDGLPALQETLTGELESLGSADERIDELEAQLAAVLTEYQSQAARLSKARKQAAETLAGKVNAQLSLLGMGGARFAVDLTVREQSLPHASGAESVEFLIATNPGQSPRALNRIASGGELSRISLAIQVVTADTSDVPTLVFDEVDVGIGGAVAEVVGQLLRQLGTQAQIICVTHLAQVASQGHQHFQVAKEAEKDTAETRINTLDQEDRIEEIARMLGGASLTEQSMAHAAEMFHAAQGEPASAAGSAKKTV